jgi:two-component system sensor histidine kinase KdpD
MSTLGSSGEFKLLSDTEPRPALQLFDLPIIVRYLVALVMTAIATVVAVGLDSAVTIPNLSLVFVVPVIIAAVAFGLGPSLCSALLGALSYNFFLTEPRFSLRVDDPANIWAIGLLFVVGAIASAVASTARHRADDVALARRQAAVVQSYSRDIIAADDPKLIFSSTANALEALFQVPVVVMLVSDVAVDLVERRGKIEPSEVEIEAARSSLTTGKVSVADVYPFDASRFDFWPVMTSAGGRAVVGLAFDPEERPPQPGTLVDIVRNLLALALDRQHLRPGSVAFSDGQAST